MSTRTQWLCVPAIESRSRPSVVESSFWIAPPVDTPNTSAPNEFATGGGGGGGAGNVLRRAALARLAARRQARRFARRVLAERALRARRRQRVSTLGRFLAWAAGFSVELVMRALAGWPAAVAVATPATSRRTTIAAVARAPNGRARRAEGFGRMDGLLRRLGCLGRAETPGFATPPHGGCAFVGSAPTRHARFLALLNSTA